MTPFGTSDDVVFLAALCAALLLLVAGIVERRRHRARLGAVEVRVAVNGSRGKSTVVRLATGALDAGGFRTLGKTTGSEPRLLRAWEGEEEPIHRRPEGPNVGEQLGVVRRAADLGADALVAEVMAINPDYQRSFVDELTAANVLVVTNVLGDHLEEMGPTTADVAAAFGDAMPDRGTVVIAPGPHADALRSAARARGNTVVTADPEAVDPAVLRGFEHLVFAEHVALVLALADVLGIPADAALLGMRAAPVDPLATRLLPVGDPERPALFVNAFGANDPTSSLAVWQHVLDRGHASDGLVTIMNCRGDRIGRTRQFVEEVLGHLPIDTLVVTGSATQPVLRAVEHGDLRVHEVRDYTDLAPNRVVEALLPLLTDRVLLGVGNLHGGGVEIVRGLEQHAVGQRAGTSG
ncbi:poly-gamma-glutamate synthase PgsB [Egibacter rhizosphaerae]|uniref:Poly-gamma-glutamate synthase PgsB n=1 Tax=Egibacter rhizosphaerae TaxID=1670831 RepID=A0A411YAK8_9ACTN|nr:poly-gamma-glutamate synthase PgsB [Egibacter rhizosphaerae]QBI18235.1 poly-gamma-glutamate synthase PgsB [Egibacter rhizosphaerae]